jgi:uncharacterized protein (TIGR03437 family)
MLQIKAANWARFLSHVTLRICAITPNLLAIILAPVLSADSAPWALLDIRQTGYNQNLAAVSPTGPVYLTNQGCPEPTITLGDSSLSASCVTKTDAAGNVKFATEIGGASAPELVIDSDGNIYVSGDAGFALATTPVVYESSPPDPTDPFVCKFDGTDGHALFCTFIDLTNFGPGTFTVDSAGNTYIAGLCGSDFAHTCVEKLNADGSSLVYRTSLSGGGSNQIAVDSDGNLFVLYGLPLALAKLDANGFLRASVTNFEMDEAAERFLLTLDPAGNPQLLSVLGPNRDDVRVARYKSDLSSTLFATSFSIGSSASVLAWAIDSTGVTDIFGITVGADLPLLRPTQVCHQPTNASLLVNGFLVRTGDDGQVLQSAFVPTGIAVLTPPQVFISPTDNGATVLVLDGSDLEYKALDLGPGASEVSLACIGNAASLEILPLAPNEIISLFGTSLGPNQPITGQPGNDGPYPSQLGGVQVTFDGTPAPILYVSKGQVNVITPGALAGKTTTHACVVSNGPDLNCIDVVVQPAAPGVFQSQPGYAAAVNQDGTVNSQQHPAPIGSIISIFVTGIGSMSPAPIDGSLVLPPLPAQDLVVHVQYARTSPDGQSPAPPGFADILYVGPAPFEVAGIGQINVLVPFPSGLFNKFLTLDLTVTFPDGTSSFVSNTFTIWWSAP